MEHQGQTNETHEITLPSAIEQVQWGRDRAAPGGKAGLHLFTRYVGNGATLEIKLTDERGSSHGTFKDQLYNNRLTVEIAVPPKAREALYAEVKLPDHGLSESSPPLLIMSPVTIENVEWSESEARRGDVLTLSADIDGVPDGTEAEVTIFEHDEEGAHIPVTRLTPPVEGGRVEIEWAYEYHDRTEDIPREEEAEKGYHPPEYFFRVEVEGVGQESDLLTFKDWLEIELTDRDGQPVPEERYVVTLPDGEEQEGTLDKQGKAIIEDVPPGRVDVQFPDFGEAGAGE